MTVKPPERIFIAPRLPHIAPFDFYVCDSKHLPAGAVEYVRADVAARKKDEADG